MFMNISRQFCETLNNKGRRKARRPFCFRISLHPKSALLARRLDLLGPDADLCFEVIDLIFELGDAFLVALDQKPYPHIDQGPSAPAA
jgi:hypothetical protein